MGANLDAVDEAIDAQARQIDAACEHSGLRLLRVVGERTRPGVRPLARPGLSFALELIAGGEADGLVVADLTRLAHSSADLGGVLRRLRTLRARLISASQNFDTATGAGRLGAALLIEVSDWDRKWIGERTRKGLAMARAQGRATGRAAVADHPDLMASIAKMRSEGMTLQAIADRLNADGVPTLRGGAKWRHSSVQAAVGYRRGQPRARV